MEEELQELRGLIAQLKADNEKLRQDRMVTDGRGAASVGDLAAPTIPPERGVGRAPVTDHLVLVPRDRRCPKFSGKSGLGIDEWVEEAQACMRVRHLTPADQAFFLVDHLEGEAREEIRYRSEQERGDPDKIIGVLRELYGCSTSYIALQEAFFSRRQQEGDTLLEFSLVLLSLLERVKQQSPNALLNADVLLRDQFVECVANNSLRRELKQLVRRQATLSFLDVRGEAIRWEREGMPGAVRSRSHSVPLIYGTQYGVRGEPQGEVSSFTQGSEMKELRELLRSQQEQITQLVRTVARLRPPEMRGPSPHRASVICRRCQRPGHFARECDGERVSHRTQPSIASGSSVIRSSQPPPSGPSGN